MCRNIFKRGSIRIEAILKLKNVMQYSIEKILVKLELYILNFL